MPSRGERIRRIGPVRRSGEAPPAPVPRDGGPAPGSAHAGILGGGGQRDLRERCRVQRGEPALVRGVVVPCQVPSLQCPGLLQCGNEIIETLFHKRSLGTFAIKRGLCVLPGLNGTGAPQTHFLVRRPVPFSDLGLETVRCLDHPGKITRTRNVVESLDPLVKSRLLLGAQGVSASGAAGHLRAGRIHRRAGRGRWFPPHCDRRPGGCAGVSQGLRCPCPGCGLDGAGHERGCGHGVHGGGYSQLHSGDGSDVVPGQAYGVSLLCVFGLGGAIAVGAEFGAVIG